MKRILSLIIIFIVVVSCDSFLEEDPKGQLVPEAFFETSQDLELAENGLYYAWYKSTEYIGVWTFFGLGANDLGSSNENGYSWDVFAVPSDHAMIYTAWCDMYALVKTANNVINNYERCDATQDFKDAVGGAAYFMRAFAYFNFVRIWNEVPFYLEDGVFLDIETTGPQVIYEQIIEDLSIAESICPNSYDGDSRRENIAITRGMAKSLLAYVYLQMTGYPINDTSKASHAANKAKEVIDNEGTYGYKLLETCDELWKWDNYMHDEIVLAKYYNRTYGSNPNFPMCPRPSGYGGGWDCYYAELKFFNDFPEGPRKEATFETDYFINDQWVDYTALPTKHPYVKKYWQTAWSPVDPETGEQQYWKTPSNWNSSRTEQLIRHANTLLVYAEAQAMADGSPNAAAYNAINRVRNRAGLPDLTSGLSGAAFRDSVVKERAWEFAGEWFTGTWYDLVRLERVEEVNADRTNENEIVGALDKSDYFQPVPMADVLINPNIGK